MDKQTHRQTDKHVNVPHLLSGFGPADLAQFHPFYFVTFVVNTETEKLTNKHTDKHVNVSDFLSVSGPAD